MGLTLRLRRETPSTKQMRWVPGGQFLMGCNLFYPEERPVQRVRVEGFWMDAHPVTVSEFRRFVRATGYVTLAERPINRALCRQAGAAPQGPGALVFLGAPGPVDLNDSRNWWRFVAGACWHHPEGSRWKSRDRESHPVSQVAYADAAAYADWAGKTLPTEAEWEYAARGGIDGAIFAWGDAFCENGHHMANSWQGEFPWQNLCLDGHEGTSPVGSYPRNGYGLYDMTGNVWEWTSDYFVGNHAGVPVETMDACGASPDLAVDLPVRGETEHLNVRRVVKGGSYLCAPNYSMRCRPAARLAHCEGVAAGHLGFRCIVRGNAQRPPSQSQQPRSLTGPANNPDWVTRRELIRQNAETSFYWTAASHLPVLRRA